MSDQYLTIATIASDEHMLSRVTACAGQQNSPQTPELWAWEQRYRWAASPGWAQKWDSALASNIAEPGTDPAVITDGDILAVVQPMLGS
jgi:hypothetical protein